MTPIRLYHDRQKALVPDEEGDIIVQTAEGEERRSAEMLDRPGSFTTVTLPDGYDPSMTALSHLIDTMTARHFDAGDVHSVGLDPDGPADPDAEAIAKRLAAFLDAEFITGVPTG